MNYGIIESKGKFGYKLVRWDYIWQSDTFRYEYGTSNRVFFEKGELPFKMLASLRFQSTYVGGFLNPYKYPENNAFEIEGEKLPFKTIKQLRGYKKFFNGKNICGVGLMV